MRNGRGLGWIAALVLACGDGDGGGSSPGPVPEDELVPAVADSICDLLVQCDCETSVSADNCHMLLEATLAGTLMPPEDAGLRYDAACGGRALGVYDRLGCGTVDDLAMQDGGGEECAPCKVYHGTKQVGDACMAYGQLFHDDCAQGLVCDHMVCRDPCVVAQEGEECQSSGCVEGLICVITTNGAGETSACVRPRVLGEPCDPFCADGLVCSDAFLCEAAPDVGQPCSGECREGSWCDTSSDDTTQWVCAMPKPNGASCTSSEECASDSCDSDMRICEALQPFVCELGI